MKQSGLYLGALLTVASIAGAQEVPPTPVAEVGLNYSLLHANSFIYKVNHRLGPVGNTFQNNVRYSAGVVFRLGEE